MDGISTVIIFIITILLLSLGTASLWFLYRYIKDCNWGSDNEHALRKTRRDEQRFLTLPDIQKEELQRIAELKDRFKIQSDNLQLDKIKILNTLQGYHYSCPFPYQEEQASQFSERGKSTGFNVIPAMMRCMSDQICSSMSLGAIIPQISYSPSQSL